MTAMAKASGMSSRVERALRKFPEPREIRYAVATPDTRNNSDNRQGEVSIISGSMALLASGLFTCQSQVT